MDESDHRWVAKLLWDHAGNVVSEERQPLIETRLRMYAKEHGVPSVEELLRRVRGFDQEAERVALVEALLNGETLFFRDVRVYQALREHVIPRLIELNESSRRLSIWSSACASGQEPYSVAMLLQHDFPLLDAWQVNLLATDLSQQRLARARAGRYTQLEVNRGLPARMLVEFFLQDGVEWVLAPQIRRRVEFGLQNLLRPWAIEAPVDLLLMRNVLIYFDDDTRLQLLRRAHGLLSPGGYLVLGGAENALAFSEGFEIERCGVGGIYRKR